MIRVLVADDQALVRAGFVKLLDSEDDMQVVGEAGDGSEAIDRAAVTNPDVVLMDIRMPRLDGIAATRRIRAQPRAPRVVILTTFDLDEYVFDAIKAGASGFLLKDAPAGQLVGGVRLVASGEALLAPSITRRLIEEFARRPPRPTADGPPQLTELTSREREIMTLVARGMSNAEIAAQLVLGESTVKTHVGNILMKLDLRDRVQAVVLAYETGLVQPGET
ncbi:MAG TPA: response regulator transcription factor [Thermoleophilaceae bacterium]|nr:response regulator transcription factor [Thermoleophilaceae bacterium]